MPLITQNNYAPENYLMYVFIDILPFPPMAIFTESCYSPPLYPDNPMRQFIMRPTWVKGRIGAIV